MKNRYSDLHGKMNLNLYFNSLRLHFLLLIAQVRDAVAETEVGDEGGGNGRGAGEGRGGKAGWVARRGGWRR